MLKIQEFISSHNDWEALLKEKPYAISTTKKNGLVLFSYNMIDSDPKNEIVKEARGLILEAITFKAVCVPFFRFYNHTESYCSPIDWNTAKVQEKIDGSLEKLYFYNDKWNVATNNTIDAFECNLNVGKYNFFGDLFVAAMRMSAPKEFQDDFFHNTGEVLNKNYTYIFELVSLFNRIVVPYDIPAIYHIGTRDNVSLQEINIDLGVQKPKEYKFSTKEDCYAMAEKLPFSEEGYVVVDAEWNRVKVKSPAYLAVHHLRSNDGSVSPKRAVELIMTGEDIEFLSYYKEYTEYFEEMRAKINNYKNELLLIQKHLSDAYYTNRKELALWAKTTINSDFAFGFEDGKYSNPDDYMNILFKSKGSDRIVSILEE